MTTGITPDQQLQPPVDDERTARWRQAGREIVGGPAMIGVLAVLLALVVGAVLIAATDQKAVAAAGYFFARPGDFFSAAWQAVAGAYTSLFQGAVFNPNRPTFVAAIRPFTETLRYATPLITAGLGLAVGFRVSLFNIGGRGQMLMAAAFGGWVGFAVNLPPGLHLLAALVTGILAGAVWGGIVGLLKAKTGTHEVIATIMLNWIAYYLVSYWLRDGFLKAPGSLHPQSPPTKPNAQFFLILGPDFKLHFGFVLAIAATVFVWWFLERSHWGMKFRAVGINPRAAAAAGISVSTVYIAAMAMSGGLVGLAGVNEVLGTTTSGFDSGIDSGIGFQAITVALLGRSRALGVFFAGILFGAFKAGGFAMQSAEGVPIDLVLVLQSLIVLFIAAPPLVRAIFRLPVPTKDGAK